VPSNKDDLNDNVGKIDRVATKSTSLIHFTNINKLVAFLEGQKKLH
jgi:hypothetical protein